MDDKARALAVMLKSTVHRYHVIQAVVGIVLGVEPTDPQSRLALTYLRGDR